MNPIAPNKIRFIKLGEGGEWEQSCIKEGTIRLGYHSPHHQDSLAGNWDNVRKFWLEFRNGHEGAATRDINQIRDFYELDEQDVWITFYKKKLYWCRAAREVVELDDKSRIRNVIGNWLATDINGQPLRIENIDGRVTKVQGFRGTICSIELQDYLIRKINGIAIEEVENAKSSLEKLKSDVEDLIKGLWWHDFELLIDLVFSKAGWQRFSVLGKTEKDLDLDVYSPATQKRVFVQIKSTTTRDEVEACISTFNEYEQFDEMYFVYHTCHSDLSDIESHHPNIHLWGLKRISALVVNAGLVEWLINKRT
ncbi:restriction endonuclease [Spirulina sp. 06S082]|uniref:restriction endonuclease n=1 Tax=Spirulina sp. 06S082 TaxID=3110248 RepID=UPI002B2046FD|nr:restriction endonuclease [Spirulina sp. 06S082]MEA5468283.1 restriction endonuclease [Spirulina sp. 06S082]